MKGFEEELRFLSNFWVAWIVIDGVRWPSTEHYYQAMKTLDEEDREKIRLCPTPGGAKRYGSRITLRPDWDEVKLSFMKTAIETKFQQHPDLLSQLLETPDELLVEHNTWGDVFWGVCNGVGQNHLGRILQETKKEYLEFLKWRLERNHL